MCIYIFVLSLEGGKGQKFYFSCWGIGFVYFRVFVRQYCSKEGGRQIGIWREESILSLYVFSLQMLGFVLGCGLFQKLNLRSSWFFRDSSIWFRFFRNFKYFCRYGSLGMVVRKRFYFSSVFYGVVEVVFSTVESELIFREVC